MDKNEFEAMMRKIADALPDKGSPEVLSLIFANIVMIYEVENEWPSMMMATTKILADAMAEAIEDGEASATEDANAFLKNIMENHND